MSEEKKYLSDWTAIQGLYEAAQAVTAAFTDARVFVDLNKAIQACDKLIDQSAANQHVVEVARVHYEDEDDNLRIDNCAIVDGDEDGMWVSGLYFVSNEDASELEEEGS